MKVSKIGTHDNVADMIATNVAAECLTKHLKSMDCSFDTAYSTNDLRIDRVSKDSWLSKNGACGSWTRLYVNPRSARFMQSCVGAKRTRQGRECQNNARHIFGWLIICGNRWMEEFRRCSCSEWETLDGIVFVCWCDVIVLWMRSLSGGFSANTSLSRGGGARAQRTSSPCCVALVHFCRRKPTAVPL